MNLLEKTLGANWKTTVSAGGTALMAGLTFLAGISYDQGPIALVIPVKYKPAVTLMAGCATLILWFLNGILQKSKDVTGGIVKQMPDGSVLAKDSRDLSNLPAYFSFVLPNGNLVRKATADATEDELEAIKLAVGQTTLRTVNTPK